MRKVKEEAAKGRTFLPLGCEIDDAAIVWMNTKEIALSDYTSGDWPKQDNWNEVSSEIHTSRDDFRARAGIMATKRNDTDAQQAGLGHLLVERARPAHLLCARSVAHKFLGGGKNLRLLALLEAMRPKRLASVA